MASSPSSRTRFLCPLAVRHQVRTDRHPAVYLPLRPNQRKLTPMPKSTRTIRLERLQGQVGDVAYELTQVKFSNFHATGRWRPAINAYRCEKCLRICCNSSPAC